MSGAAKEHDGETLTLHPRRLTMAFYGVLSAAFTVGGALMIRDGDHGGWFVAGFFGICTVIFLALLLPGAAYLRLTHDGFRVRSLWRTHFTPWPAVIAFGVARVGRRRLVVFTFADVKARRGARYARILTGVEGALPDSYGMSPEKLAELMTHWHVRARTLAPLERREG
ncbi:MAG: hypothetical protein ACM3N5_09075 [Candidatus Eiseniibacteriota bacterium]